MYNPDRFRRMAGVGEIVSQRHCFQYLGKGEETFIGYKVGIINGPRAINRDGPAERRAGRDTTECKDISRQMSGSFSKGRSRLMMEKSGPFSITGRLDGSNVSMQLRDL